MARGAVLADVDVSNSENKNSFHEDKKAKMAVTAMPLTATDMPTRQSAMTV
ncbi:hypothetical protein KFU94_58895 [Chloroflexi bacterium TSY]|nr:hypothetical protein [Chloroflexi bacterium TSY]